MTPALFLGVDVGSSFVKMTVITDGGVPVLRLHRPSTEEFSGLCRGMLDQIARELRISASAIGATVATGYGRDCVPFADEKKTELACHAMGAYLAFQREMTLVDIGGQDNKVIRVGKGGAMDDFTINRKCAAGTGSFLEVIARRLGVGLEALPKLADEARTRNILSSYCTVFAETEVLERMKAGEPREELAMAGYRSVAKRVYEMASLTPPVVASGGVMAFHPPVRRALEDLVGSPIDLVPHPQYAGAMGAAWFAKLLAGTSGATDRAAAGRSTPIT